MGGAGSTGRGGSPSTVVAPASGTSGAIRRATPFTDALRETYYPGEVTTVYQAFRRGARAAATKHCMGYRPVVDRKEVVDAAGKRTTETVVGDFTWFTYNEIVEKVDNLGSGLVHLDLLKPNDLGHRLVGIYGKNRWEWSTTQHAAFSYGAAIVPLYDTLGAEAVSYIVQQTGLSVVAGSRVEARKLVEFKRGAAAAFATLTSVVQWEDVTEEERKAAADAGLTLRSFAEVAEAGSFNKKPNAPPTAADIAVICYTSGTTGNPKGAVLTHRNMVADASAANFGGLNINRDDVHLSYLPLAHVFEQLVQTVLFMEGAQIGFFQGDTLKILDDIKALRPTLFPSVPRLFNRIYDKIMGGVAEAGGVKAAIFHQAFATKQYWLREGGHVTHSVWDGIAFKAVAVRVGLDRCRLMVSGSAPLAAHVMEFLRIVFCTVVVEGYGQTECGGAATVQNPGDMATLGHVGAPLACNEVKLVSVEDLGYLVTDTVHGREVDKAGAVRAEGIPCDGRGEVCYRGPNIFPGYYKDAEKTAEALDADGWLHSGDIGIWTAAGYLKIVDRKKNMFKLSQGEYVAAEKVEVCTLGGFVQQIFVYGDSLHSMLVAIVVPNPDALRLWARENHHADTPLATLCTDKAVKTMILKDLQARGKAAGLQGFEIPKDLLLDPEPWSPERLMTPTFKLKRADAKRHYQEQIDAMYSVLDPVAGKAGLKQGATTA